MYRVFYTLLLLICFISCEEITTPELEAAAPVLIVEAQVSNLEGSSFVKLSTTVPYDNPTANPAVENAQVSFTGPDNRIVQLIEQEAGTYRPTQVLDAKPGEMYSLTVVVEEAEITGTAVVPLSAIADSVSTNFYPFVEAEKQGHFLVLHYKDRPFVNDQFLWELKVNGEAWLPQVLKLEDDKQTDGRYLARELAGPFFTNDTLRLQIRWVDTNALLYYTRLKQLIEVNSPSQTLYENPPNNLSGAALGYFTATFSQHFAIVVNQ
jgi:hypothetical protein